MSAGAKTCMVLILFILIQNRGVVLIRGQADEVIIGVNWGSIATHKLPPQSVVKMLQDNRITRIKLFDADPQVLQAFSGSGIEIMIAIANDRLEPFAASRSSVEAWVQDNVTRHVAKDVNIKYVALGNEPFLKAYNGTFENVTLPALKNLNRALKKANLTDQVKATVPLNADVLRNGKSGLPSSGKFRSDIRSTMQSIVEELNRHDAPFVINIYPFLSLQQDPNFPKEFAFFDSSANSLVDSGGHIYNNVFDANFDLLVNALAGIGFPNISIIVGEVGWPTDGSTYATIENAHRFNQELINHARKGTPMRPGNMTIYLFGLIDEDAKSILPGNFERHWGIYSFDGKSKYPLDLSGQGNASLINVTEVKYLPSRWCVMNKSADAVNLTKNVEYACQYADCTALVEGGSCNLLDDFDKGSYAFNSYYQMFSQVDGSCDFQGLAMITDKDPSLAGCSFNIQLALNASSSSDATSSSHPTSPESSSASSAITRESSILLSYAFACCALMLSF